MSKLAVAYTEVLFCPGGPIVPWFYPNHLPTLGRMIASDNVVKVAHKHREDTGEPGWCKIAACWRGEQLAEINPVAVVFQPVHTSTYGQCNKLRRDGFRFTVNGCQQTPSIRYPSPASLHTVYNAVAVSNGILPGLLVTLPEEYLAD